MGASGRMGRELVAGAVQHQHLTLTAAIDRDQSAFVNQDAGLVAFGVACGVLITDDLSVALLQCDVLIDFTQPEVSLAALSLCVQAKVSLVVGTTGFTEEQKACFVEASQQIAIVLAPNMSPGVNLMFRLVELATQALHQTSDIEILEAHHKHKVDAPSGTALLLGELVAQAAGLNLSEDAVFAREGQTGARKHNSIGFATVRAGDIVGEHTVLFAGQGERLEITHKASHRKNFAMGALRAANWLADQGPGLYSMQDVLGLNHE